MIDHSPYFFAPNRIGTEQTPFERDNPLQLDPTIARGSEDRAHRLQFERLFYFDRRHQFNVIQMNSTFIEFINSYHPQFGRGLGGFFLLGVPMIILALGGIFFSLYTLKDIYIYEGLGSALFILFIIFILIFATFYFIYWFYVPVKRYELNGYYYLPVRFNRKTQKVYFFTDDGEQIERYVKDVRFMLSEAEGIAGTPNYELSIMVMGKHNSIKYHTTIGQKTHNPAFLREFWNLINIYMVHGPQPLSSKNITGEIVFNDDYRYVTYCNPVQQKEASWFASWHRIRLMHYQNVIMSWTVLIPLDLFHLLARRICLGRKKMPVWNDKIEAQNQVDADDPYITTAQDNFIFGSINMSRPYQPRW